MFRATSCVGRVAAAGRSAFGRRGTPHAITAYICSRSGRQVHGELCGTLDHAPAAAAGQHAGLRTATSKNTCSTPCDAFSMFRGSLVQHTHPALLRSTAPVHQLSSYAQLLMSAGRTSSTTAPSAPSRRRKRSKPASPVHQDTLPETATPAATSGMPQRSQQTSICKPSAGIDQAKTGQGGNSSSGSPTAPSAQPGHHSTKPASTHDRVLSTVSVLHSWSETRLSAEQVNDWSDAVHQFLKLRTDAPLTLLGTAARSIAATAAACPAAHAVAAHAVKLLAADIAACVPSSWVEKQQRTNAMRRVITAHQVLGLGVGSLTSTAPQHMCVPLASVGTRFRQNVFAADDLPQLMGLIQNAADSMGAAHAAIAFTAVAKLLDKGRFSSSNADKPKPGTAEAVVGLDVLTDVWSRELAKVSVQDLVLVLISWSKIANCCELVHAEQQLWGDTVSTLMQRRHNIPDRQLRKAAVGIAAAAAVSDSALLRTAAQKAVLQLGVEFARRYSPAAVDSAAASTPTAAGCAAFKASDLLRIVSAHEQLALPPDFKLQSLIDSHQQQMVEYGQQQMSCRISEARSLQALAQIMSSIGSSCNASVLATAANKVSELVREDPSQLSVGAGVLHGPIVKSWQQVLGTATCEDIRAIIRLSGQLQSYRDPVLVGQTLQQLSEVLQKQQALQGGAAGDRAQQQQQQQQEQEQLEAFDTSNVSNNTLHEVLYFTGVCAEKNGGHIPGLPTHATASLLDTIAQHFIVHLQPQAVLSSTAIVSYQFTRGVSLLLMARAAVSIPPSHEELSMLLKGLGGLLAEQERVGVHIARIVYAIGKLHITTEWQPSLKQSVWERLLHPRHIRQLAATSPKHVANTVNALCLLAQTPDSVGAAPSLSREFACSVVQQLLQGAVAQNVRQWNMRDVRKVLLAFRDLEYVDAGFVEQMFAAAVADGWDRRVLFTCNQLLGWDRMHGIPL